MGIESFEFMIMIGELNIQAGPVRSKYDKLKDYFINKINKKSAIIIVLALRRKTANFIGTEHLLKFEKVLFQVL